MDCQVWIHCSNEFYMVVVDKSGEILGAMGPLKDLRDISELVEGFVFDPDDTKWVKEKEAEDEFVVKFAQI